MTVLALALLTVALLAMVACQWMTLRAVRRKQEKIDAMAAGLIREHARALKRHDELHEGVQRVLCDPKVQRVVNRGG